MRMYVCSCLLLHSVFSPQNKQWTVVLGPIQHFHTGLLSLSNPAPCPAGLALWLVFQVYLLRTNCASLVLYTTNTTHWRWWMAEHTVTASLYIWREQHFGCHICPILKIKRLEILPCSLKWANSSLVSSAPWQQSQRQNHDTARDTVPAI